MICVVYWLTIQPCLQNSVVISSSRSDVLYHYSYNISFEITVIEFLDQFSLLSLDPGYYKSLLSDNNSVLNNSYHLYTKINSDFLLVECCQVICYKKVPPEEQIKELLRKKDYREAIALAEEVESEGEISKEMLSFIHAQVGFLLLFDLHFEEAVNHFLRSETMQPSEVFPFIMRDPNRWSLLVCSLCDSVRDVFITISINIAPLGWDNHDLLFQQFVVGVQEV